MDIRSVRPERHGAAALSEGLFSPSTGPSARAPAYSDAGPCATFPCATFPGAASGAPPGSPLASLRRLGARLLSVLGLGLLAACGSSDEGPPTEVRQTSAGTLQGSTDTTTQTLSWKGIPYAQAPVGPLRWATPQEVAAWSGTRDATQFGQACAQNGRIYGPGANNRYDATIGSTLNTPVGHEDCLYLNIWRPQGGAERRPVIVFVHGGSNISGYTADPVYDGAALARAADAVVVTVNYRLDIFGFFNLPQLKTGDAAGDSGNFALLDILQALRYVNRNIAAFGGDPGNVTLMGQSAGAINIWALLASPQSAGLMHKLVPISGGISLASNLPTGSLPTLNPPAVSLAQANALLARLLIADGQATDPASAATAAGAMSNAEVASYLRAKPAATLLSTLLANGLAGSGPIPDGQVVPSDPIAAIAAGRYNAMPILASNTRDEGKLFAALLPAIGGPAPGLTMTDAQRFTVMANYNPDQPTLTDADVIAGAYLPVTTPLTGFNARTEFLNSIFFGVARDNVMNTLKTRQSNLWYYRFDWDEEPVPWNNVYGAAHAFDLPFVFGNFGPAVFSRASFSTANAPGRLALSGAMMNAIGAFARRGDPNDASLGVTWAPWPARLIFDASPTSLQISTQSGTQ